MAFLHGDVADRRGVEGAAGGDLRLPQESKHAAGQVAARLDSINRRISIIVMTKEADESALKIDAMPEGAAAQAAAATAPATTSAMAPVLPPVNPN